MGIFGVHIHRLQNRLGYQTTKGDNPFHHVTMQRDQKPMSSVVKVYDPPSSDSKQAYAYITSNLAGWVEEAIEIRKAY